MKTPVIDKEKNSMSKRISVKELEHLLEISPRAASREYQRILDVLEIKNRKYLILLDLIKVELL